LKKKKLPRSWSSRGAHIALGRNSTAPRMKNVHKRKGNRNGSKDLFEKTRPKRKRHTTNTNEEEYGAPWKGKNERPFRKEKGAEGGAKGEPIEAGSGEEGFNRNCECSARGVEKGLRKELTKHIFQSEVGRGKTEVGAYIEKKKERRKRDRKLQSASTGSIPQKLNADWKLGLKSRLSSLLCWKAAKDT